MELNEVVDRILRRHIRLIAACVVAGLLVVWVVHRDDRPQFEAVVRMVLDSPDPTNQAQASVLADTARGIASGSSLLRAALDEVGAVRDPVTFGEQNIDVRPLGSSGVLRLVVTDRDPKVAVAMSNAIAAAVIAARQRVTDGTAVGAVRSLEREIASLERQLTTLDQQIDTVTPRAVGNADQARRLRTLERSRDALTRRLGQLQGELVAIQGQRALRPQAGVIDPATSARKLPGGLVPDYLLGGLLGLILGVGAAAARETVRPSVAGPAALARSLGAPVLASLGLPPEQCGARDVAVAARHLELAAVAAGVARVELMGLDRHVDMRKFTDLLDAQLPVAVVHGIDPLVRAGPASVVLRDFMWSEAAVRGDRRGSVAGRGDPVRTGLVAVLPAVMSRGSLEPVRNLLTITGWPLLGVIVFPPPRPRLLGGPGAGRGSHSRPWLPVARARPATDGTEVAHESAAVNGG